MDCLSTKVVYCVKIAGNLRGPQKRFKESLVIKTGVALLTVCAACICAVQPSAAVAQSAATQPKHYRLTFVLNYPDGQPSQIFVLNVPVKQDHPGMAGSVTTSGLTGQPESSVQENLQCTDVKVSALGLAAKVGFSMDSIALPLPGPAEPIHRNLTFNRQVNLVLGTPTRITEEPHAIPSGKGGDASANTLPHAPQITVTAIAM